VWKRVDGPIMTGTPRMPPELSVAVSWALVVVAPKMRAPARAQKKRHVRLTKCETYCADAIAYQM
jgi:hypothetical protein